MAAIRVAIVDDHALVREGLRRILEREPDLEVIAEASTADAARTLAASDKPDVMLVDISLGDEDGIVLIRDLHAAHPELRLVALTMHLHDETVRQAFLAGAAGYVVKGATGAELLAAVRAVAHNQSYVHPTVASVLVVDSLRWLRQADRLSQREMEVLRHITAGRTAAETGEALGISAHTVRRHVANLAGKAGVHGRVALTRYALEHHLVHDES
jgi:DNA-binding NarL/FixJ family response regulator